MKVEIYLNDAQMEQLANELADKLSKMFFLPTNAEASSQTRSNTTKNLTREETASLLGISLPTLHSYTQKGLIKSYKIGSRVLYKESEVQDALLLQEFSYSSLLNKTA